MVTGVEIAGLVIGSLPLVMGMLKTYAKGLDDIKSLGDGSYRRTLRGYLASLEIQRARLLNVLPQLMDDTLDVNYDDLSHMDALTFLEKPNIQARLQQRLGHNYKAFKLNILALDECAQDILKAMPKIGDEKTEGLAWIKTQLKKTKGVITKEKLKELLDRAQNLTSTLEILSESVTKAESRNKKRRFSGNLSQYRRIRKHARSLYRALSRDNCWQCTRENGHVHQLSIKLENSVVSRKTIKRGDDKSEFVLTLWSKESGEGLQSALEWLGDEFRVEPWNSPPLKSLEKDPMRHTAPIKKEVPVRSFKKSSDGFKPSVTFAATTAPLGAIPWPEAAPTLPGPHLHDICRPRKGKCKSIGNVLQAELTSAGVLRDTELAREHLYEIFHSRQLESQPEFVSLEDLIKKAAAIPEYKAGFDSLRLKGNCLRLACILSTNTIHFYGSWFNPFWQTADIVMIDEKTTPGDSKHPYITRNVPLAQNSPALARGNFVRSWSLLPLGFCLIELAFCQTMAELQEPGDVDDDPVMTKFKTANRLLSLIYPKLGQRYGNVVRECLTWSGNASDDMDDEDFQSSVFELVVRPLLEDLSCHEGSM